MARWQAYNSRDRPVELDEDSDTRPLTHAHSNDRRPLRSFTIYDSDSSEVLAQDSDEEIVLDSATPESELGFNPGDYLTDEDFQSWFAEEGESLSEVVDLTAEPRHTFDTRSRRIIPQFFANGYVYTTGQSVELSDGSFLRILHVLEERPGEIFLRGDRFRRLEDLGSEFPNWLNELCWIANEATHDAEEVSLVEVKRFRIIHLTNWRYPNVNLEASGSSFSSPDEARQSGELYCRLKQVKSSKNEGTIHYLTPAEADEEYSVSPALLRQIWREETPYFGSAERARTHFSNEVINLDSENTSTQFIDLTAPSNAASLKQQRQYTFGDGFCGAGGVSRGAVQAGLHIKWAFDKDLHAARSYRLNFQTAICDTAEVTDFLSISDSEHLKVDVCHASPPCQPFSSAHTVESSNDDANSACIFSGRDLVERSKPRIYTMEETSGLYEQHRDFFFRVTQDLIEIGYSVRWKMIHCIEHGVPQLRKRFFIIASGPGDVLPAFPKPTHGLPGTDLLPYATIQSAISNIPEGASDHDVEEALSRGRRNGRKPPYDPNTPARTITCSGGEFNYHPSGERNFTNRELACLQTFPLEHRFGQGAKRQIGNAVPPMLAKAVFREVVKSLQKTDEAETNAAESEPVGLGRAG